MSKSRLNYAYLAQPYINIVTSIDTQPDYGSSKEVFNTESSTQSPPIEVNSTGSPLPFEQHVVEPEEGITANSPTNNDSNYSSPTSPYLNLTTQSVIRSYAPTLKQASITSDDAQSLNNITLNYYKAGVDTGISTAVKDGSLTISDSVEFDSIKLSEDEYSFDSINISDAIDVLRHIVDLEKLTEGSVAYHAADVDNNNAVNISDAIDILRHIVNLEPIDTFDIVDSSGDRVTRLDSTVTEQQTWMLVANGDVNLSGSFDNDYIYTVNESPILSTPTQGSITEDAATNTVTGALSATDPESDALSYSVVGESAVENTYTVTGTYGTLTLSSEDGSYSYALNNSLSSVQALSATDSKNDDFSVSVSDGTNSATAQTLRFVVTGANDAPSSISVSNLVNIDENDAQAIAASVSATDVEDGSLTVALSGNGADDDKFEIVNGNLRIKSSADYESQSSYRIQLSATDNDGATTVLTARLWMVMLLAPQSSKI